MEVKVSQHSEVTAGGGEMHVLVPILRDDRVSLVLESGLEGRTFYTVTLFFDLQYITSTNICEYIFLVSSSF